MPLPRAVVWIDHRSAKVLQFDTEHVEVHKIHAHAHETRQHGSGVRAEHVFFAAVCDGLAAIPKILMTGPRTALADFRHYIDHHRPAVNAQIIDWETSDQVTDGELVALARKQFERHARMAGLS